MRRLICETLRRSDGSAQATFYCIGENGQPDSAIANTLLEFVELSHSDAPSLESIMQQVEAGNYVPKQVEYADWGVNEVNLWLRPPMAEPAHVCISNENTEDYSADEGGRPQQFTFGQFRAAMKHWRDFCDLIARDGKEALIGRQFEAEFPD